MDGCKLEGPDTRDMAQEAKATIILLGSRRLQQSGCINEDMASRLATGSWKPVSYAEAL
jgi:hypothetical protein